MVRALYLEAGVADVAAETGDAALLATSITRWDDMVATKTYLTGGNGSRHEGESFGDRFELPPDRAYNETCAAIASFQWSWRLLLATGQARYADLMERILYNGFAASIATDGTAVLLRQPAAAPRGSLREGRPGTPARMVLLRLLPAEHHAPHRLAPALPGHHRRRHPVPAPVHRSPISTPLAGGALGVAVSADFPWSGEVTVRVTSAPAGPCGLALRVPSWSSEPRLLLNGKPAEASRTDRGYLVVHRQWQPGDVLA